MAMPILESFRIEVLSDGQRLPDSQLIQRIDRFSGAVQKLLGPLRLGKRLQFHTENDGKILWLLIGIEPSGQMGLYETEDQFDGVDDPEHYFEVDSSKRYLEQAIRGLQELSLVGRLTAAALERFIGRQDFSRSSIPGIGLLDVGLREKNRLNLKSGNDSTLVLDCTDLPKLHTSETLCTINFRVESIGKRKAHVWLPKESRRLLDSTKSEIRLFYPVGSAGKSIRAALFDAMERETILRWAVRGTRSLLGAFHSAYCESLAESRGIQMKSTITCNPMSLPQI